MSTAPNNEAATDTLAQAKPPFLRRVRIRGYKSIAFCDVTLEPLTILVGRNASGKSNFLDALGFLRDTVVNGVHAAVKLHGGRDAVLCQSQDPLSSFLALEIEAVYQPQDEAEPWTGAFAVEIALPARGQPRITRERVRLGSAQGFRWIGYTVEGSRVTWDGDSLAHPINEWLNQDKVLLGMYGSSPFFWGLFERIESIRTYNFNPDTTRRPQKPVSGGFLERDGSNLASVIETTREAEEWAVDRAGRYLTTITQDAEFLGVDRSGGYETLRFRVPVCCAGNLTWMELPAASMSDGTLRAFAALVAAFQVAVPHGSPSIVAIEEPETSLHPAAMRTLVDALDEATLRTQILLTTHSAELLDNPTIRPANIRVVQLVDGQTVIGPVDEASVEIVARKLNSLGGLERENQLEPDLADRDRRAHLAQERQGDRP